MERKTAILAIVSMSLMIGCAEYPKQQNSAAQSKPVPEVEKPTYIVERGSVVSTVRFLGMVEGVRQKELFFKTSGRVRIVRVQRGDRVKSGELLAELQTQDLKGRLTEAQISLETAELRLEEAQASNEENIARAEINLLQARYRLAQARAQDPRPSVEIAKAQLDQAEAGLETAKVVGTSVELKKATRDHEVARSNHELALQSQEVHSYQLLMLENEVKLAQLSLDHLRKGSDPVLSKQVVIARLAYERLEQELSDSQIVAPFSGMVVSAALTEGALVDAYRQGITIMDPAELEVAAEPDDDILVKIRVGQTAVYTLMGAPGRTYSGKVVNVPFGIGEERRVRIGIDPAARGKVAIGDTLQVSIEIEKKENVLHVPSQAIRTFAGRKFIIVKEGDRQYRMDVKTGIEGEDGVEIQGENLKEGMVVLGV